jgi:hypothetical protein
MTARLVVRIGLPPLCGAGGAGLFFCRQRLLLVTGQVAEKRPDEPAQLAVDGDIIAGRGCRAGFAQEILVAD